MTRLLATILAPFLIAAAAEAGPVTLAKDQGPVLSRCDHHLQDMAAWRQCVGAADVAMPKAELFYAGYWLARSGDYRQALTYLTLADQNDPRVATYIGFSIRKLGDLATAFVHYNKALKLNPGYAVARAYLGEAFLAQDNLDAARSQLREIETRCGSTCPEFVELKGHIDAYLSARGHG